MFGSKEFPNTGYPTPESTPENTTCLTVQVPDNAAWWAIYIGLLFTLTDPAAWQQLEGGMSREDAAAAATDIFIAALKNSETDLCGISVPVPFWDTATGDDTNLEAPADDQVWYGRWDGETWGEALSYWAITAFLMTGVSEGAAVQFVTPLRHFRLTLKANPHGAKLLVLMDSNLFQLVDLFAPADTVVTADIISPGTTMLLVHSGEHNPDATPNEAGHYEVNIIRSELSEADVAPTTIRYDPDCACVQTTSDGGATWQDNPNADPRTSVGYLLPPVASADPACDAAASIIANFRDGLTETLNAITAGANAEGAASVLLTFLDFLSGIGILILLLIDFCTLIVSIGVAGVEAAFTSAVYDELQCIIQCAIGTDGSISAAQFANIQTKVSDRYGALSDVNLVFQGWIAQLGNVGLQNIGAQKHIVGDCAGCSCCECTTFALPTRAYGFYQLGCTSDSGDFLVFDSAGMGTSLSTTYGQGAAIDLRGVVGAGATGWCISVEHNGLTSGYPLLFGCAITAPETLGSGICFTGEENLDATNVIVPADHPFLIFEWRGTPFRWTGICVQAI